MDAAAVCSPTFHDILYKRRYEVIMRFILFYTIRKGTVYDNNEYLCISLFMSRQFSCLLFVYLFSQF